jgi:capsular polysaccharide export protein
MNFVWTGERRFLFLQGMPSRFLAKLGKALRAQGHEVRRINFNGGDRLFWPLPGALDYRGRSENWPAFLEARLAEWQISDVILFGDCRPLHRAAIGCCTRRNIPVHVLEEGYLRPNWITVEKGGVNANSSLARDPAWYAKEVMYTQPWTGGATVRNSMWNRAVEDIAYNAATILLSWRYPHYRSHRPWHPLAEYRHGARRFLRKQRARREMTDVVGKLQREKQSYFVFPLQLDSDFQIRLHSRFGAIEPALKLVIESFAANAPQQASLVITEHPLDTSPMDWSVLVRDFARAANVDNRVYFFEGGCSDDLLRASSGVVTVNSTSGVLALNFGLPVIALGRAIYDMPGLTFQNGIDLFWKHRIAPDPQLFDAFRRVVAARTQVNGCYFGKTGLELAVEGTIARLHANRAHYHAARTQASFVPNVESGKAASPAGGS